MISLEGFDNYSSWLDDALWDFLSFYWSMWEIDLTAISVRLFYFWALLVPTKKMVLKF